jgi:hypothetical protein
MIEFFHFECVFMDYDRMWQEECGLIDNTSVCPGGIWWDTL